MHNLKKKFFILLVLPVFYFSLDFQVEFSGLNNKKALFFIKSISTLTTNIKVNSINELKYIASKDKDLFIQALQAFGYFDASISIDIEEKNNQLDVFVFISTGPMYVISSIELFNSLDENKKLEICDIENKLPIKIDGDLNTEDIINTQKLIIYLLSTCGYPYAKVEKRDVLINKSFKNGSIKWNINPGHFYKIGDIKIQGLKNINPVVIRNKLTFEENEKYNQNEIIKTQNKLLASNLFSSVKIRPEKNKDSDALSIDIDIIEALHRQFTTGISYATVDGFGINLGWENRNIKSMGNPMNIDLYLAQRMFDGIATYRVLDFIKQDQDLVFRIEGSRENIPVSYLAFDYSYKNRIDKRFSKKFDGSLGIGFDYLLVNSSSHNGNFFLISLPVYGKYSTDLDILNPKDGYSITYRASPYVNTLHDQVKFFKQTLIYDLYIPLDKNKKFVFAARTQLGSILGPNVLRLPLPLLFLGGSDDDLRGYKYRTVSPLNNNNQPLGGRSCVYFSFEPRVRVTRTLGFVPFMDIGNVSNNKIPDFHEKWLKSFGIGFRYFSFFGPLRLDIAFPLNKRKNIDEDYRIYANIGQTF